MNSMLGSTCKQPISPPLCCHRGQNGTMSLCCALSTSLTSSWQVRSYPVGIGFLAALAAAALGSRLLQATGRGRAAAAQQAATSPEEVRTIVPTYADTVLMHNMYNCSSGSVA